MHIPVLRGSVPFGVASDVAEIGVCVEEALACSDAALAMVTSGRLFPPLTGPGGPPLHTGRAPELPVPA